MTATLLSAAVLTVPLPAGHVPSVTPAVPTRSVPYALTAAIAEDPTTLGVADSYLYQLSDADIDTTLDALQAMGVNDIRVGVPWVFIQPYNSSGYDWTKLDYIVDAATERGMNILGVINGTPRWAGTVIVGHPSIAAFENFATAVATRYDGKIYDYEIWNEPNGATGMSPVSAAAYTKVLKAGYTAIKSVDPTITVIGGVLGSVGDIAGLTVSPVKFVQQMYADGAQGYFDALSFHPYNYTLPFSLGGDVSGSPLLQVEAIRALMDTNGDSALKIWISEYGLPTNLVSQQQQATYIADFVSAWQSFEGAGPIFIYTTRDSDTGNWSDQDNYGIFQTNWAPKKAVAVLTAIIQELKDGTFVPTTVDPSTYKGAPVYTNALILTTQLVSLGAILPSAGAQIVGSLLAVTGELAQQAVAGVGHVGYQFGRTVKPFVPEPIFNAVNAVTQESGKLGTQVQGGLHTVANQAYAAGNEVVNQATAFGIRVTAHVLAGIVQVLLDLESAGAGSGATAAASLAVSTSTPTAAATDNGSDGPQAGSPSTDSSAPDSTDSAARQHKTTKAQSRLNTHPTGARHSNGRAAAVDGGTVASGGAADGATPKSASGGNHGDASGSARHLADRHRGTNAS